MKKMKIEDKLALNIFHVDEENSHIDVDTEYTDEEEIKKLLLAYPTECYKYIDGKLTLFLLIVQVFGSALAGRETLLARLRRAEEAEKLRNNDDDLFYENVPFFQRVVEPFVNSMIQAVGRTISLSAKEQSKLENDLAQAGIRMRTRDYAAMRLMIIALFTLVCTYYGYVMYKTLTAALLGVLLGLYMGYTVMRFALASRITRRRANMLQQLPNFLDLLSVCVEAGLGFDQGVGHVEIGRAHV